MSSKVLTYSELLNVLKEIEQEVIRVLGKEKENVLTITDSKVFHEYVSECISTGVVALDTETNNSLDPLTCKLMGLCLYSPGMKQVYVPVNHRDPSTKIRLSKQLTEKDIQEELQRIIDSKVKIITHNGKFDYEVLKCTCDITINLFWDTMVAARLLNENESYSLKNQYVSKIDKNQEVYKIDKLFKNVQYSDVKPELFALYSAHDAFMTYKLYEYQLQEMENEQKIFKLFTDIEMPLVVIVAEMELGGAVVDIDYCQKLKDKYETKILTIDKKLEDEIIKIQFIIDEWKTSTSCLQKEIIYPSEKMIKTYTKEKLEKQFPFVNSSNGKRYKYGKEYYKQFKEPINLSSPKQLAILLYQILQVPVVNRRKPQGTGKHEIEAIKHLIEQELKSVEISSEDEKLKRLQGIKCICELLNERRKVEKILTTYIKPVTQLVNHWGDGKVRFHLNQLGARTGRFTSGGDWKFYENEAPVTIPGMNSQNLPSENHEIRLMFKTEPGRIFVGGDISQQEPKITAHIAQDEKMIQVYEEGKDIYASIAQSIFNTSYEDNLEFKDPEKTQINPEGKKRRKVGKTIILATMYGMGERSVSQKLNVSVEEAQKYLSDFYGQYVGVKKAISTSIENCKQYGYVEDILGRKRRLPNIKLPLYRTEFIGEPTNSSKSAERLMRQFVEGKDSLTREEKKVLYTQALQHNIQIISNEELIEKAKRQSFNARIQGSAATLTKKLMVMVYNDKLIKKLGGRIVFQIHDELILDCPIEHSQEVSNRLKELIENSSTPVGVVLPMKCDMTTETRWGEGSMTTELREIYQDYIEEGIENPLDKLCEEFCNFPRESIEKIINNNETLEFEW